MSTAERIKSLFADPEEELTIITEDTTLEYDLGGDYRLDVVGQPDNDEHPLQYRVVDESARGGKETTFTVFEPASVIFESESVVDRYASVIEGLVHETGAETFRDVIAELGEDYRNGHLLVLDSKAAKIIKSTADVEFNPEDRNSPWEVYFVDDHVRSDWGMDRVRITTDRWTHDRPSLNLPTGLTSPSGDTWRTVRLIWTLMYARDAGADVEETHE